QPPSTHFPYTTLFRSAIRDAAKELDKKMTPIEEELIQVKTKSSQDPLNYPLKLNNVLAALGGEVMGNESAPNQQEYELFKELSGDRKSTRLNSSHVAI